MRRRRINIENTIIFKIKDKVRLVGYQKNIIKKCRLLHFKFIVEDPGFVLIESAIIGIPIISSDCENGPRELIKKNVNGFVFRSNDQKIFLKHLNFIKIDIKKVKNNI